MYSTFGILFFLTQMYSTFWVFYDSNVQYFWYFFFLTQNVQYFFYWHWHESRVGHDERREREREASRDWQDAQTCLQEELILAFNILA